MSTFLVFLGALVCTSFGLVLGFRLGFSSASNQSLRFIFNSGLATPDQVANAVKRMQAELRSKSKA